MAKSNIGMIKNNYSTLDQSGSRSSTLVRLAIKVLVKTVLLLPKDKRRGEGEDRSVEVMEELTG